MTDNNPINTEDYDDDDEYLYGTLDDDTTTITANSTVQVENEVGLSSNVAEENEGYSCEVFENEKGLYSSIELFWIIRLIFLYYKLWRSNDINNMNVDTEQTGIDSSLIQNEDDNELGQVFPTDIHDVDPLDTSGENGNLEQHEHDLIEEPDPLDIEIIMDVPSTTNKPTDNVESGQASSRTPGVDINAVGSLDGTSIYDVDLDSVEDKPWRKPGADITDYFNYGFNEYTWKAYCAKQKQMREDQHARKKIHVYESKQEVSSLPPELQSISQPQSGLDHPRFQQQRGRGRRGRDQDDSVIQVVSSEREAALEEMDPIPPPTMDGPQNEDYDMDANGYPHDFQGPPMGMRMFPPPDMQMGPPPPFFMGNPEVPPTGPMGFDPTYQGGQPMRRMMRPTGMPGGMPGMATRMPPTMPGGMSGGMPGMPRGMPGMPGGMVGRGRGMSMDERPFFSMDDQSWEMENRNSQSFRPGFAGRPPTGPMHGGNRSDFHDWEHSPPPEAPFSHRIRPNFRPGAPPTGPAEQTHHRNLASVDSPSSDRGE
ncbi:13505_t:CDS:10 [Dentiscutata erythropus]|uniref:13505_t:CDS:1 n=1 Tax=Dentiscutata erythropus TaxID=1348616 RepID=A0A9N9NPF8_9GLOM|nr:13505_t:CDS:10 [Dentiscutata erythropus]